MSSDRDPTPLGPASQSVGPTRNLAGLEADDPAQVVEDLFHWSRRLVGIDGAILFLIEDGELEARFGFELPTQAVSETRLSLDDDGPIQACVKRGATQVIAAGVELKPGVVIPWRVAVCIPLAIEGSPIGAYVAGWNAPFEIGNDTILVLEGAASMAASSVHRARLLYQVKREEQRLRTLLDLLPIPALAFNTPDQIINHVNAEARQLIGDARGRQVRETMNGVDASHMETLAGRDPTEGIRSATGFTRFQMKAIDGSTRIVFPHLARLGSSGGVIMLVDVTHETNLEMQRKRFVRMISHHLRTPLTPLMGYAEVVGATSPDPTIREALSEISAAVEQITDQVERLEQIADLQPLDEGNLSSAAIKPIVLSAWDMADGTADDLSLEGDLDRHVICNPDYVIKAMAEIFTNAYLHGRPPVHVEARFVKGEAVVTCRDSGDGISHEWESAVFAPYLTTHSGYEAPAGGQLGLGLTLARALIEATLGRLSYDNGSFVVRLPLDPTEAQRRPI